LLRSPLPRPSYGRARLLPGGTGRGAPRFAGRKRLTIIDSLYTCHRLTTPDKECYLIGYLRNDGGVNVISTAVGAQLTGVANRVGS